MNTIPIANLSHPAASPVVYAVTAVRAVSVGAPTTGVGALTGAPALAAELGDPPAEVGAKMGGGVPLPLRSLRGVEPALPMLARAGAGVTLISDRGTGCCQAMSCIPGW